MDKLKLAIEAMNAIDPRIHAVIFVLIGSALCCAHQVDTGKMIIGGGLVAFQNKGTN